MKPPKVSARHEPSARPTKSAVYTNQGERDAQYLQAPLVPHEARFAGARTAQNRSSGPGGPHPCKAARGVCLASMARFSVAAGLLFVPHPSVDSRPAGRTATSLPRSPARVSAPLRESGMQEQGRPTAILVRLSLRIELSASRALGRHPTRRSIRRLRHRAQVREEKGDRLLFP